MREVVDAAHIRRFLDAVGRVAGGETRLYLTGGASAVLIGWRVSTIDIDLTMIPEDEAIFRALPRLKEELRMNVELANPSHFIPEVPGWRERSLFIERIGRVSMHHYDFYSQALAKIERGHEIDRLDVGEMLTRGLVEPSELRRLFNAIEPLLYRYPAIDPGSFRSAVRAIVGE